MATRKAKTGRSNLVDEVAPVGAEDGAAPAGQDLNEQSAGSEAAPVLEPRRSTKASLIQQMLSTAEGATLAALIQGTGWQAHTVRAALTRLRQTGQRVERTRSNEGQTVYRIVAAGADTASLTGCGPAQGETTMAAEPASSAEASPS